jgi:rare lipoprotein A
MLPLRRQLYRMSKVGLIGLLAVSLVACATSSAQMPYASKRGWDGTTKVGKPYQVTGVWYYPEDKSDYQEEGIASWYGADFHNRLTANGELFDMNDVSAAHKTLPMPSYVTVTNLDNGREITVRINDRGPFKPGRIIDMSRRAAQILGMDATGTAKVRVRRVYPENAPEVAMAEGRAPRLTEDDLPADLVPPAVPADVLASAPLSPSGQMAGNVDDGIAITGGFFVQVAAVGDEIRANILAADVRRFGATIVEPLPRSQNRVYRVRLGPFLSRDGAEAIQTQVHGAGYLDAHVLAPQQKIG